MKLLDSADLGARLAVHIYIKVTKGLISRSSARKKKVKLILKVVFSNERLVQTHA